MTTITCLTCGTTNRETAKFCRACGNSFFARSLTCKKCGTVGREGARFCAACGKRIGAEEQGTALQQTALQTKGKSPEHNGARPHTARTSPSILDEIRKELNIAPPYVPKKQKKGRK